MTAEVLDDHKPVRQAFGSPGGKSYLASRIVGMIPPHTTYVEPFAGGAAVYFHKLPSEVEVLSDKDSEIAFAFRFLREMTPAQYRRLRRYDWTKRRDLFNKLKSSSPKEDVERFRKFYYLRKASFKKGGRDFDTGAEGTKVGIDHLLRVGDRLKGTKVANRYALAMIKKYDSANTFFYLDPPYPNRASVQTGGHFGLEDLLELIRALRGLKGKFILSLSKEHTKLLPATWRIKRVWVKRKLIPAQTGEVTPSEYELIISNYDTEKAKRHRGLALPVRHQTRRRRTVYRPPTVSLAGIRG